MGSGDPTTTVGPRQGRHPDRPPPREGRMSEEPTIAKPRIAVLALGGRSEEHTSELQSLMRISYAVFCLKKKNIAEDPTADTSQRTETGTPHTSNTQTTPHHVSRAVPDKNT